MNNLGNLRSIGSSTGFQQFDSPLASIQAMRDDLLAKISGNSRAMKANFGESYTPTLASLISTYAPPTENNTDAYIKNVANQTGIDPSQPLQENDVEKLLPAMIKQENGQKGVEAYNQATNQPSLPEGFVLDGQSGVLPEGFVLDSKDKNIDVGKPGSARTSLEQGLQGATFGLADEVSDRLGSGIASLVTGDPYSDLLKEARNNTKQRLPAEVQDNPLTAIASNIGGALLTGGVGATTKAGSAIADLLRSSDTTARVAKSALAGAASGGLYGLGSADDGSRAQGAEQGALLGGTVGGAIPGVGAAASSLKTGAQDAIQGALARSPEALQDAASSLKSNAGALYNQMRQVGAVLNPQATQSLISDINSAVTKQKFIPNLNPKTVAIIDDMKMAAKNGTLGFDELDQYRRLLSRVGGSEDGVSASAARKAIDDAVSELTNKHLVNGGEDAVNLLKQGRQQYAQASKFEDITDILTKASGDPNKIKAGLTRFLNNSNNLRGYTKDEISALKEAAKSTTTEKLLKMGGKFGIDLGSSLSVGNTIAPVIGYGVGGGIAPVAGTIARQGQKYLARGKAENLLNVIQGGKSSSIPSSPNSPLLSLLGMNTSAAVAGQQIPPIRIGLRKVPVRRP